MGDGSMRWIEDGGVEGDRERKYAVERPIMPVPRIAVCGCDMLEKSLRNTKVNKS